MARMLDGRVAMPTANSLGSGPWLTLKDHAALARAPRRRPGTEVTVWARPVGATVNNADHMYDVFDDGRRKYIARGGPSSEGGAMLLNKMAGDLSVRARVDPASQSPDYGAGRRVLARGFLPGVSADKAVMQAELHAAGVNRDGNRYGFASNSNSYAADVYQDLFGRRPGDDRTWGYGTRLRDTARPPSMHPPILRGPPY